MKHNCAQKLVPNILIGEGGGGRLNRQIHNSIQKKYIALPTKIFVNKYDHDDDDDDDDNNDDAEDDDDDGDENEFEEDNRLQR